MEVPAAASDKAIDEFLGESSRDAAALLASPPACFTVRLIPEAEAVEVTYRRHTGRTAPWLFAILMALFACSYLVAFVSESVQGHMTSRMLVSFLAAALVMVGLVGWLLWLAFGTTTVILSQTELAVRKHLLRWTWERSMTIQDVEPVHHRNAYGPLSRWWVGLAIKARQRQFVSRVSTLVQYEDRQNTLWLARLLGDWCGVQLSEEPE